MKNRRFAQPDHAITVSVPKVKDPVPGSWVTAAIEAAGVTSAQLAERLDVNVMSVSRWRRGEHLVSPARWDAIKAALGLAAGWRPPKGYRAPPARRGRPRVR